MSDGTTNDAARVSPYRVAFALAAVKLAVHALTLKPYGFFRDELYYIACSEHLAWGYVDHPPFCVALLRVWRMAFGDSLVALRMLPALVGTATVLVTGLLAIRLGGRALAVALAQVGVLVAGLYLAMAHFYSMNVLDQLFWVLSAYVLVRAVESRSTLSWIALGVTLGLGLMNKTSVLWLGAGILGGLLATPSREALRTKGPYVAGVIALAIFAPYVAWEVRHGWPTLEFMKNAIEQKYVARSPVEFLREQLDQENPFTLPVWLVGLVALVTRRLGARVAALGWIYLVALAILITQKTAKAEYLSPAYPMLMAAGGVMWERALAMHPERKRTRWARPLVAGALIAGMLLGGLASAPFALACLSEERFIAYQRALGKKPETTERREVGELPQFYADMHEWPELASFVADVYDKLTPEERAHATIWTRQGGYGSAAAIDFFGRARGLPRAICGHNNYWLWGPGDGDGSVVIIVGGGTKWTSTLFESVERVGTFECKWCRPDENHKAIYVARKMKMPLAAMWPEERYFD